jgi:hypothetical protein
MPNVCNGSMRLVVWCIAKNVYYPNQEWNLRHLPNGLYHMQVLLEDGGVISQKVMKE